MAYIRHARPDGRDQITSSPLIPVEPTGAARDEPRFDGRVVGDQLDGRRHGLSESVEMDSGLWRELCPKAASTGGKS